MSSNKGEKDVAKAGKKAAEAREALMKSIRETEYDKLKKVERERDADAALRKAEQDELAAKAGTPAQKKQQAKADAALKDFKAKSKELVDSGVQGYDRFDTSMLKIIAWSKQGAVALNENLQPWTNTAWFLNDFVPGLAKGVADQTGLTAGARGAAHHIEDMFNKAGLNGEVDYDGPVDISGMVNIDGDTGALTFTQKFVDMDMQDDEGEDIPDERKELMDKMFQETVRLTLVKNGYQLRKEGGVEGWMKPGEGPGMWEMLNNDALQTCIYEGPKPVAGEEIVDLAEFYDQVVTNVGTNSATLSFDDDDDDDDEDDLSLGM
ncbi:MAG: hypothetical protein P1U61_00920 [Legionellaceae bacterium]|nr:hypothetical protein [Legionellaceae bacterium]